MLTAAEVAAKLGISPRGNRRANDMTTYSMVKKRYSTAALRSLRFVPDGSRMVKRGACRRELAEATSLDGQSWRVRPLEKGWRS